jgi:glycosyltransferase involved in cell wall biosynthesis
MRTLERLEVAQVATAGTERRTPVLEWNDRLDLLLHALAQLPDAVTLEVEAPLPELRFLRLIAGAYAIEDRVTFHEATGQHRRGVLFRPGGLPSGTAISPNVTMAEVIERVSRPKDPPASLRSLDAAVADQRIAVVTNLATHYRVPLFNEMARRLAAVDTSFRAMLLSDIPRGRAWMRVSSLEFDHEVLDSIDVSSDRGRRLIPRNLESRLSAFKPTIVLSSGFSPAVSGRAALFARRQHIPFGIWSGEISTRSTAKSKLRRLQRAHLARHAQFGIAYGWESIRYLSSLRPELPIVLGRNTTLSPHPVERLSRSAPIELLTVGRAQKGKALDTLVDAILGLEGRCRLTIVGDGPELAALRERAMGCERIRFVGALPFAQVMHCYRKADVFLFPSQYDVFGLVLVEAMGAGLCVLVSSAAGAVADLAVDGHNCLVLNGPDPQVWREALRRVAGDAELRMSLGRNARRTIERRWTTAHAADAMIAGLRLAVLQAQFGRANGE